MRHLCTAATTALLIAAATTAQAQTTGEFGLWVQANAPSGTLDDGDNCDGIGTEFCQETFGFGSSGSVHVPLGDAFSLLIDTTLDYHGDTTSGTSGPNQTALYAGLGVHAIYDVGMMSYGAFLFGGGASAAEDGDYGGTVFGAGVEASYDNYFIQVGQLAYANGNGDGIDGIDDLTFARIGGEFSLGNGILEASAAVGEGDFEDSPTSDERGEWTQLSLAYNTPLNENMNFFVGYQGDYVGVESSAGIIDERTTMHSFQLGVNFLFGGGHTTPFSTPNFRAPFSYAGEFN